MMRKSLGRQKSCLSKPEQVSTADSGIGIHIISVIDKAPNDYQSNTSEWFGGEEAGTQDEQAPENPDDRHGRKRQCQEKHEEVTEPGNKLVNFFLNRKPFLTFSGDEITSAEIKAIAYA